uniref:Phytocyanin domain-containing protein n=1 Tax=Opuntia streptacantha TaxID=393608 RepID=A0A7C8ZXW2_OPUST
MGGKKGSVLLLTFVTILGVCSAATTYIVGDGVDWGIPSPPSLYSTWASQKIFRLGDVLEFNFVNGQDTVAVVSKAAYDGCNTNDLLSPVMTTSPARVTLNTTGTHYFLCTTPNHCSLFGQKFSVFVNGPSLSPTTSPSAGPPPDGSFTTPTAAGVHLLSLVSIAAAALFI